jgi:ABC-type Fe3+ transport system substrate-binding protein
MTAIKRVVIFAAIALVIAIPFAFRSPSDSLIPSQNDDVLVIITAHNESLRREYSHGFREWYRKKTGRDVVIDWRNPGAGREVVRYIDSVFTNNFRIYWESLGHTWTKEISEIFHRLEKIDESSSSLEIEVKKTFLASNIGCDIDIFFGGGTFEHKMHGWKGYSIPSHLKEEHPEFFTEDKIPEIFAGERLYDQNGLWYGTSLTSFVITYNEDILTKLKVNQPPETWMDLQDPKYLGKIAIVDPSKSTAVLKSFEMLIQQQMQQVLQECEALSISTDSKLEYQIIHQGWIRGLQLIQKIVANGRYFVDTADKPISDIAAGNCLIGIAVDFYGRAQIENIQKRGGTQRFGYTLPRGGMAPSPDPISLLRGAKHLEIAKVFMEYIVSLPGQQLLAFKTGVRGGPLHSPLCRTPILKTVYDDEFQPFRLEGENPYQSVGDFFYRPEWTKPVHNLLGLIIKIAFIDAADELTSAWRQIIQAQNEDRKTNAEAALKIFSDMTLLTYPIVCTSFAERAQHKDPLIANRYQMDLTNQLRHQYRRAEQVARGLE